MCARPLAPLPFLLTFAFSYSSESRLSSVALPVALPLAGFSLRRLNDFLSFMAAEEKTLRAFGGIGCTFPGAEGAAFPLKIEGRLT